MSSRRANDVIVGTTVLAAILLITAAVLWINRSSFGERRDKVFVRARDIGGVSLGQPVVIRGVQSGRVDQIALGDAGWVVLRLALDPGVKLPANPTVLLASASLFGEWQATVMSEEGLPADRDLRQSIAEARGAGDTLPGALLPDIAQLTAVAGRIAGDIAEVADRFGITFDDEAARELRASIRSFSELSGELQRTVSRQSSNLDEIGTNVQRGVRDLTAAAAAIDSVARRVDATTSRGELATIVSNVQQAAEEVLAAAQQLRAVSGDVGITQQRLDRTLAAADTVFDRLIRGQGTLGMLVNDPSVYRETDSLLIELRGLVGDIRRNPSRYFNLRIF